ncbi:hypothetical protein BGZ61DRAFT_346209, partial [Ilyonectria robusta]|uniref:uncharacterized protein n=1 Tax=Ilyonectria robusta TaxID=1079257 RepID=UPI001E8E1C6F
SCETCRRRKVKCSGNRPCQNCSRQGLDCRFGNTGRRGYSEAYVQGLLAKIKQQEEKLHDIVPLNDTHDTNHSSTHDKSVEHDIVDAPSASQSGHDEQPFSPLTDLASGPAFESRVRSILLDHTTNTRDSGVSPGSLTFISAGFHDTSPNGWRNSLELVKGVSAPPLLSKQESYRLFDVFISLMGINQHFIDPRNFSDSMILLYQSDATRERQKQTIWFTEYLLVMSMGMLIGSPSNGSGNPPGNAYFAEALRRLPPLHQLGSQGIIAVEILCLASLYLQWCDRKHDAYVYIGTAVRLAIGLGCSIPYDEQQGLPSEICHRSRVWWTAYMLDRRLSAALGLPTGADDRQLPFYGNNAVSQTELVQKIQSTLQALYEAGRSIPSNFSIHFSDSKLTVTRTGASLYLMLFQDKVVASKVNRSLEPPSPVIARLCDSCQEAAIKSIRILSSLRSEESIALFGFFDLDATFSAAFVLIMMGFVKTNNPQKPPDGLKQAVDVLEYLSAAGNKAAEQRLGDLKQFCYHVWSPDNLSEDWKWLGVRQMAVQDDLSAGAVISTMEASGELDLVNHAPRQAEMAPLYSSDWPEKWGVCYDGMTLMPSTDVGQGSAMLDFDFEETFGMDMSHGAEDIYSSFNDPDLPLTGVDEVDWAEIGKVFHYKDD